MLEMDEMVVGLIEIEMKNITKSQGGEEYSSNNKKEEG